MDTQNGYLDSPMDTEDAAYPCKGCGQVLEEGKAFELAGHRWHIDCFRCNTCGTLLDSDANLLLLGDGSLICNNCTYSCSACGNKIEDLAILTGDQAYCAGCFRCRNCKKKIENLRYARTSQGMFCMDCHDALMARRRKKTSRSNHRSKSGQNNAMLLDKSLPSLPPNAVSQSAFSPDQDALSDTYSDSTPIELPGSTPINNRNEGLTLPPSTYRHRHSGVSQRSELEDTDNGFFIPMALDPNPAPGLSPLHQQQFELDGSGSNPARRADMNSDYFAVNSGSASRKDSYVQPLSGEDSRPASPHTAIKEQGWDGKQEPPAPPRRRGASAAQDKKSNNTSQPARHSEQNKFQLQEAPKRKQSVGSKRNSKGEPVLAPDAAAESKGRNGSGLVHGPLREQHVNISANEQSPRTSSLGAVQTASPRMSQDSRGDENASNEPAKPVTTEIPVLPKRGDSLLKNAPSSAIPRKEIGSGAASSGLANDPSVDISPKASTAPKAVEGAKGSSRHPESPAPRTSLDFPQRSKDRPNAAYAGTDPYSSPSAVGYASPDQSSRHQAKTSVSSLRSGSLRGEPASPGFALYSRAGDDDDQGRLLTSDDNEHSFLKRVSKSVRHARSHSDRVNRTSRDGKWGKNALNGADGVLVEDALSPTPQPEPWDDLAWLRTELQKERERNAEASKIQAQLLALKSELAEEKQRTSKLSEKNTELEDMVDGKNTIKQVNSELREKRSTMVVLDTQKEIVVRELEILTDHIALAKKSKEPLDFSNLSNSVLRDFASSLQKLKDSYTPHIEELTERKIELQGEVSRLSVAREKAQEEFRQLSAKNVQLMELNNSMVSQVPENQRAAAQAEGPGSKHHGLGIYTHHSKDKSSLSVDSRDVRPSLADSHYSGSTLAHEHDQEGAMILNAPRVVNIRKEQPKKTFNWKKGGTVAKGMTKGLKGAFSSSDARTPREASITEGLPYGAMAQNGEPPITTFSGRSMPQESRQGFGGFFGQQKKGYPPNKSLGNGNMFPEEPMHPSKLFGVELGMRAEYERVNIPSIVTRCIEEVELRGMDQEGIYRKSGGAAQIQVIRDGFIQSNDYDISDPDLDINAVTSCLKQYFRKLPTPLITFTVYDLLLDSVGAGSDEDRIQSMRAAVMELPPQHRDCLEFLVFHLARVIGREKENLMTAMNCAVVFAPTIMRPESIHREMTDTAAKNTAVQFLIENCHAVFLGENDTI